MSKLSIERPNYFAGEALLTDDFVSEQQYHMTVQSLNNRSLYTYGIASGLEVLWDSAQVKDQVDVLPGMAIDSLGRQIILTERQVVSFTDITPGASYYLTISYAELYADYTEQPSGVSGYKRIVEQPLIQPMLNLKEAGLNIVLAVVSFTNQSAINAINYRAGTVARRYVSSTLGALTLIAEGAGLSGNPVAAPLSNAVDPNDAGVYPRLVARLDDSAKQVMLEVDASRTQFDGVVNTLDNLGIGTSQPYANLEIQPLTFDGPGAISSNGIDVTFTVPISPFFQIGDQLRSDPPVTLQRDGKTVFGLAQLRTIVSVDADKQLVKVDRAFDPALDRISYTYQRALLARFGLDANSSLVEVGLDGSVGLGTQAAVNAGDGTPGRHALSIAPNRYVGIGLIDRDPQSALDVGGEITAASILANGAVRAQSFEGNGSKLKNLPMLSYWTLETVGSPTSNLYYNDGNVGIRNVNPIGSLSVGGGHSVVGSGYVTSLSNSVLQGYQTVFTQQVSVGDLISIGSVMQLTGVISEIHSDTELVVQQQLPVIVTQSAYQYAATDGSAPKPGDGTISSDGSTITGIGTKFKSKCEVGGKLVIASFTAATSAKQTRAVKAIVNDTTVTIDAAFAVDLAGSDYQYCPPDGTDKQGDGTISSTGTQVTIAGGSAAPLVPGTTLTVARSVALPEWMRVKTVDSDTSLTLVLPDGGSPPDEQLFAATSAFLITPSVLGYFGVNPDPDADDEPPAMLVVANKISDAPDSPLRNTVAINVPLGSVQSRYVLQVDGDVNFTTGSLDVDDLEVKTLTATVSVAVQGDDSGKTLLSVGEKGQNPPALTVDKSGLTATSLTATSVGTQQLTASDALVAGGTVAMLGARQAYSWHSMSGDSTQRTFSQVASTDGCVTATVGNPNLGGGNYFGLLTGTTLDGSETTAFTYALGIAQTVDNGKKGGKTRIPVPGTFTLFVRKGETWRIDLQSSPDDGNDPSVEFYWVPFGGGTASSMLANRPLPGGDAAYAAIAPALADAAGGARGSGAGASPASADAAPGTADDQAQAMAAGVRSLPGGGLAAQIAKVREALHTGQFGGMIGASQEAIDQRMGDLTRVLGDAVHMNPDDAARQRFTDELAKIVCAPGTAPVHTTSEGFQASVATLVDAFAQAIGRSLDGGERSLMADGIAALVRINDTAENRHDLNLIRQNIELFLDNVQKVVNMQFDTGQRRMLTRALVRLVGDGSGADRE